MAGLTAVVPTGAERLLIWRRRNGLNQVEAAKVFKVSPDKYREWEAGKTSGMPRKTIEELTPLETCLILRRRKKWSQKDVATAIGCSRLWVVHMELGIVPSERLREFWGV